RPGRLGEGVRGRRAGPGRGRPSRCLAAGDEAARPVRDAAVRTRVLLLAAILALAFGGLTARLGWLMIVKHGELTALAERQYSRTGGLPALRGPLPDRPGAPPAPSAPTRSPFRPPRSLGAPGHVA